MLAMCKVAPSHSRRRASYELISVLMPSPTVALTRLAPSVSVMRWI